MNVYDFIKQREVDWQALEKLISNRQGRTSLRAEQVHALGTLYRAVASDLALARRDYPDHRVTVFLNQLLTRTHSYIYQQDTTDLRPLLRYFTHILPQAFRRLSAFILAAFLLFIVPAVIGYVATNRTPQIADSLGLGEQRRILAEQRTWTNISVNQRPYASAFIMQNNIRIAILAFGGGMLFGLFTVYVLISNGMLIGATLGLAAHYGMGASLLQFISGHGVIELSVIFISGGAGLHIGWALFNPGRFTRRDSVTLAVRRALPLVLAALPLLVIAGLIEGFFSPGDAPFWSHIAVGGFTGLLLYTYLLLVGWEKPDSDSRAERPPAEANQIAI